MTDHDRDLPPADDAAPPDHAALRMLVMLLPLALLAILVSSLDRLESRRGLSPLPVGHRVDINAADRDELALLPGVGPGVAEHIIDQRETAGPFRSADDLESVHLIGPITRRKIEPWVVFEIAQPDGGGSGDHRPPSPPQTR